jgi:hypothetical protein
MVWDINIHIIDPSFFDVETGIAVTTTSDRYVNVVKEFFFLHLSCRDIAIVIICFQKVALQHILLGSRRTPKELCLNIA